MKRSYTVVLRLWPVDIARPGEDGAQTIALTRTEYSRYMQRY